MFENETFDIGMNVCRRGKIALELWKLIDLEGSIATLDPLGGGIGRERIQSPVGDLRRYRIRSTDNVYTEEGPVRVERCNNPRDEGLYEYIITRPNGDEETVTEFPLKVGEAHFGADPGDMLAQLDAQPARLVSARQELLRTYFEATGRSLGLSGYLGARMLPIPHQLNAARYSILFGRVRFLLADEVGLGKTVEAGLIAATLRKYFPHWRSAIFAPESLTVQWAFEMYGKFGKLIYSLDLEEFDEGDPGIILPHAQAADLARKKKLKPEILIIDEAHRILEDEATCKAVEKLSRQAHAVLFLTATPRSGSDDNICRLLQLADPERYGDRSIEEIAALLERQGEIEEFVKLLRDGETHTDTAAKAWKGLKLKDAEIDSLLGLKKGKGTEGVERHQLSHVAALAVDRFYPGARILRYQRKFLAQDNPMPERIVEPRAYEPSDEEKTVRRIVRTWLGKLTDAQLADDRDAQAAAMALIHAIGSSPLAVSDWLEARKGKLKREKRVTADPIRQNIDPIKKLAKLDGEDKLLKELFTENRRWGDESRMDRAAAIPLGLLPRFKALKEAIDDHLSFDPDARLIVFTGFEQNIVPLWQLLKRHYVGKLELFHIYAGQRSREREKAAFAFQECQTASLLVSDELGGEGRNFQFVSAIMHFDTPPAPWQLEQRIGRCDRVGREEELDVDSQVMVSEDPLDEAILAFMEEGIGVFNDSIAPIESRMPRLTRAMFAKAITEGPDGVRGMIDEVAEELQGVRDEQEKELQARSRVGVSQAALIRKQADDAAELEALRNAAIRYGRLFDSAIDDSRPDGRLQITVGEYHTLRGAPGVMPEMVGYFERRAAVRHERMEFFSPGHPFVRQLTMRALQDSPDRAAMIAREGLEKPAFVFHFLLQLDPSFFEAIRELPEELQPPLISKSADAFGTKILRLVIDHEGQLIDAESEEAAPFLSPFNDETDSSLHRGEIWEVEMPSEEEWEGICLTAANAAFLYAQERARERHAAEQQGFEDLLCEVLTRIFPTQEWIEEKVSDIMGRLANLIVEIDSATALFPAEPDPDE